MVIPSAPYISPLLQDILDAAVDMPPEPTAQAANARDIERIVRQCYALLRQELQRKVQRQPTLYRQDRVEGMFRQFEAVMPDIQQAVAVRVQEGIAELMRQEVRRVLREALSDLEDTLAAPASGPMPQAPGASRGSASEKSPPSVPSDVKVPAPSGRRDPSQHPASPPIVGLEPPRPAAQPGRQADRRGGEDDSGAARRLLATDEVYQGNVKVSVEAQGNVKQALHFLDQLGQNHQFRVLQIVGGYGSATAWLTLRQPLRLKELFLQMEDVADVRVRNTRSPGEPEPLFEVALRGLSGVAAVA
ncbi:MAG: hypothetical protein HYU30_03675 [Chloroflexi bacterium]|nr:hypothetical protein [Chloroflexota bacterium]